MTKNNVPYRDRHSVIHDVLFCNNSIQKTDLIESKHVWQVKPDFTLFFLENNTKKKEKIVLDMIQDLKTDWLDRKIGVGNKDYGWYVKLVKGLDESLLLVQERLNLHDKLKMLLAMDILGANVLRSIVKQPELDLFKHGCEYLKNSANLHYLPDNTKITTKGVTGFFNKRYLNISGKLFAI